MEESKYDGIIQYKNNIGNYPFFEKVEFDTEYLLIKEINYLMQKGWIPMTGIETYESGNPSRIITTTIYYIYLMRSPQVSLPPTPMKEFLEKDRT